MDIGIELRLDVWHGEASRWFLWSLMVRQASGLSCRKFSWSYGQVGVSHKHFTNWMEKIHVNGTWMSMDDAIPTLELKGSERKVPQLQRYHAKIFWNQLVPLGRVGETMSQTHPCEHWKKLRLFRPLQGIYPVMWGLEVNHYKDP